jgi:predicted dehydrogenase
MMLRGGTPFPGTAALDWRIYGSKGEIRMTSQQMLINLGSPAVDLSIYDFESGKVEKVDLGNDEWSHWPLVARNVARLYEAIADGDRSVVCDFDGATRRHQFIEEFIEVSE